MNQELSLDYEQILNEFIEECKGQLPNPDQYPERFKFLLRTYMYQRGFLDG